MGPPSISQPNGSISNLFRYWLPVAVWMSVIFSASADSKSYQHSSEIFEPLLRWLFPSLPPVAVEVIHHIFRKMCHLTEYAILAWLCWRAFRKPVKHDPRPWSWPEAGVALSLVFAYAATDELHQAWVPNRTPMVSDVLIDTAGGAIGLVLLWVGHRFYRPG